MVATSPHTEAAGRPVGGWCRGSRLLVTASAGWLGGALARRATGNRIELPPVADLGTPLVLLAVPAGLTFTRVRLPPSARRWVVGTAGTAFLLALSGVGR